MPITEARVFFADGHSRVPAAHAILERLARVRLGYLTIGQLVDSGKSVIVIEHHLAVITHAD